MEPSFNDDEYTLIYKFTHNLWEAAGGAASGVSEPNYGRDSRFDLLKKAVSCSNVLV